jgi:hypothetical protein
MQIIDLVGVHDMKWAWLRLHVYVPHYYYCWLMLFRSEINLSGGDFFHEHNIIVVVRLNILTLIKCHLPCFISNRSRARFTKSTRNRVLMRYLL